MAPEEGSRLTHLDERGRARMVDVGDRPVSRREATAEGQVRISRVAADAVAAGQLAKGDVLAVARLAGIMGAKRTPELIPLCHPVALRHVDVEAELDQNIPAIRLRARARCEDATGVEMEALTAVAVAALTVIDMLKSVDPWARVDGVRLVAKSGGRSGAVTRPEDPHAG
jgi:cyclic pyranopterin phosphate synthase